MPHGANGLAHGAKLGFDAVNKVVVFLAPAVHEVGKAVDGLELLSREHYGTAYLVFICQLVVVLRGA